MGLRAEGAATRHGARRQAATEQAFRAAWQRLEAGRPTHLDLRNHEWELSISVVCLEARHSRNALDHGQPDLVQEIRAAITVNRKVTAESSAGHEEGQPRSGADGMPR
jgi:hypothetical protein